MDITSEETTDIYCAYGNVLRKLLADPALCADYFELEKYWLEHRGSCYE